MKIKTKRIKDKAKIAELAKEASELTGRVTLSRSWTHNVKALSRKVYFTKGRAWVRYQRGRWELETAKITTYGEDDESPFITFEI